MNWKSEESSKGTVSWISMKRWELVSVLEPSFSHDHPVCICRRPTAPDAAEQVSSTAFPKLRWRSMPVGWLSNPFAHNLTVLGPSIMRMRSQLTQLPSGFFRSLRFLLYAARAASWLRVSSSSEVFLLFLLLQFVRRGNSSSYSLSFFLVGIQLISAVFVSCIVLQWCFLFSFWCRFGLVLCLELYVRQYCSFAL